MENLLLADLNSKIDAALSPHLGGGGKVALLDFPNHSNVGDSAIYLGEMAYLNRKGIDICYSCEYTTYSKKCLAEKVGNGSILLHGGGNFGDLWPEYQAFRQNVIKDFPNNRIIQLPQTVFFGNHDSIVQARDIMREHSNFFLLVRDMRSLDFAENELRVPVAMCPDLALALGPLKRPQNPAHDVLWLSRTDQESAGETYSHDLSPEIVKTDWLYEQESLRIRFNRKLSKILVNGHSITQSLLLDSYKRLALMRLMRGCNILSTGRVVVADRLHAHILCLLLGIPHYIVDNNYGKLKSFYETWTSKSTLANWSDNIDEALSCASRKGEQQG
jgi:exopolysaccharide biosynthesis predicted pyruvyltransferase EpsI